MITKENVRDIQQKRLEAIKSANFITKSQIWKAIRNHCLECKGSFVDVTNCDGNDWVGKCPLWPYRFGKRDATNDEPTAKNALRKAIRAMCCQCMSGNIKCGSGCCGLVKIRWGEIHS